MLVLGRKNQESILIGDDIRIVIDKCQLGHCKVLIEAPRHISIVRGEIAQQAGQLAIGPSEPEQGAAE